MYVFAGAFCMETWLVPAPLAMPQFYPLPSGWKVALRMTLAYLIVHEEKLYEADNVGMVMMDIKKSAMVWDGVFVCGCVSPFSAWALFSFFCFLFPNDLMFWSPLTE